MRGEAVSTASMPSDAPVAAYRDIEAARLDHTEKSTARVPRHPRRARGSFERATKRGPHRTARPRKNKKAVEVAIPPIDSALRPHREFRAARWPRMTNGITRRPVRSMLPCKQRIRLSYRPRSRVGYWATRRRPTSGAPAIRIVRCKHFSGDGLMATIRAVAGPPGAWEYWRAQIEAHRWPQPDGVLRAAWAAQGHVSASAS
jgi:hypothetical protein